MGVAATVICDASFYQHSAKKRGVGGWAAWVRVDDKPGPVRAYGTLKSDLVKSSTEAELQAAINGIWIANKFGATSVLVRSDCMSVSHLILGVNVRSVALQKMWHTALHEHGLSRINLRAAHVKGHGNIACRATWVNDWCDRHAKLAMRKARAGEECLVIS